MPSRPVVLLEDVDVVAVAEAVRRYVASAVSDPHDVDDITQETVSRLLANRWRVDRRTAPGYAVATARSLIISAQRTEALDARHRHRLVEPAVDDDPVDTALAVEEESLLAAALAGITERDRSLLLDHHVEGLTTADIAALRSSSAGAVAAALARARGRLRLEYCLQAHRTRVEDRRCRSILTAIAVGDGRRQTALGASRHLPTCDNCRSLSAAVTASDRHGAMFGLVVLFGGSAALVRRVVTGHPAVAVTGVIAAGAAAGAVVFLPQGTRHLAPAVALRPAATSPAQPKPSASPRRGVLSGSADLLHLPVGTELASYLGRPVLGRRVPVLAVDANEGFWIGTTANRIWVQLSTSHESKIAVRAGTLIDFAGTVVANPPGYATKVGVTKDEDAAYLTGQHVHLSVPAKDIAIAP